jgi:hypothetical protein
VSHGPGIPIPLPPESLSDVSGTSGSETDDNSDDEFPHDCNEPQLFSQSQLYLASKFPRLSEAKLKEGVFVGPDIRKLMRDKIFHTKMKEIERSAWLSFKEVVKKFLGNCKDTDFENIVGNMMKNLKALGCSMSLKLHFLDSHLSYFPENLGAVSEEQGERFHQDIKEMERRYQGQWNVNMIADYCWMLHI